MAVIARRRQTLLIVVAILIVGGLGLSAYAGRQPRSAEQREAAAQEILSSVQVSPAVVSSTLVATQAIADFGIQEGVRLVHVRILEELDLELRLEAGHDLALSEAPVFCLVGPFSAPDDAGLEDRCWGEPDLGAVVAAQLLRDDGGHPTFRAGEPLIVSARLKRGDVRCDYPPGEWRLETKLDLLVDGSPVGPRYLPDVGLDLPFTAAGPLPLLPVSETRYCGLASLVYREQGEPPVESPAPD